MRNRLLLSFFTLFSLLGFIANAYPGVAVCAMTDKSPEHSVEHKELLLQAKTRVAQTFGSTQETASVLFFSDPETFWPLQVNEYGSTSFMGFKTCVLIGPNGQNIDVVSHEIMHAEIESRVGYWRRLMQLPTWFDEGLAMQVDYRNQYNLTDGSATEYIKSLTTARQFFKTTDKPLTHHYASAKAEVGSWVQKTGPNLVYAELESIRSGKAFNAMWEKASDPGSKIGFAQAARQTADESTR